MAMRIRVGTVWRFASTYVHKREASLRSSAPCWLTCSCLVGLFLLISLIIVVISATVALSYVWDWCGDNGTGGIGLINRVKESKDDIWYHVHPYHWEDLLHQSYIWNLRWLIYALHDPATITASEEGEVKGAVIKEKERFRVAPGWSTC